MLKEFFIKRMLKSKGVSDEQIASVLKLVESNPELFKKIAEEIKVKMDAGQSQEAAAMDVMLAHQNELKRAAQ
ncbi:MAG: hypothetical protein AAB468_00385 [Patescibacteria group bacterium]